MKEAMVFMPESLTSKLAKSYYAKEGSFTMGEISVGENVGRMETSSSAVQQTAKTDISNSSSEAQVQGQDSAKDVDNLAKTVDQLRVDQIVGQTDIGVATSRPLNPSGMKAGETVGQYESRKAGENGPKAIDNRTEKDYYIADGHAGERRTDETNEQYEARKQKLQQQVRQDLEERVKNGTATENDKAWLSSLKKDGNDLQEKPNQKTEKEKPLNENEASQKASSEQRGMESIISSDEYKQIFAETAFELQKDGKNPDMETVEKEALARYEERKIEETEGQIESEQKLTPEQKKEISREFRQGFKDHPDEMNEISKRTIQLAKAKAREEKLKEDPKATEEQKTKATENIAEIQREYDRAMKNVEAQFGKDSKIVQDLKEALNNSEYLNLLKKEKRKFLFRMIIEIIAATVAGGAQEMGDKVDPIKEKQS